MFKNMFEKALNNIKSTIFPISGQTLYAYILIFEHILELYSNLFYAPLSRLSWNTDTYRTQEIRLGCFSICH